MATENDEEKVPWWIKLLVFLSAVSAAIALGAIYGRDNKSEDDANEYYRNTVKEREEKARANDKG